MTPNHALDPTAASALRLLAVPSSLRSSTAAQRGRVATERRDKVDVEALMNDLLPFAQKMLREHREFLPFGAHMKPDGVIVWESAYDGREHPPPQDLIDLLRDAHQEQARSKSIKACATVYDIRTIPPGRVEEQDAIAVNLDHESGYSVVVIFPYSFRADGQLFVEPPFANKGDAAIFGEPRA